MQASIGTSLPESVVTIPEGGDQSQPRYSGRRPTPAIIHFAILGAFILPITLAPYLLARQRLRTLQKSVERLREENLSLIQDFNHLKVQVSANRDALGKLRIMEGDMSGKFQELKAIGEKRELVNAKLANGLSNELRRVREVTVIQNVTFGALGTSLANVAAFMQEVNLRHGTSDAEKDKKIEMMRALALSMDKLKPNQTTPKDPKDPNLDPLLAASSSSSHSLSSFDHTKSSSSNPTASSSSA